MKKTFFLLLLIIPFFVACSDSEKEPPFDITSRKWVYISDEIVYELSVYTNQLAILREIQYKNEVAYISTLNFDYIYQHPTLKFTSQIFHNYIIEGYLFNEKLYLTIDSKEFVFVLE